jgi:hypothetical protein
MSQQVHYHTYEYIHHTKLPGDRAFGISDLKIKRLPQLAKMARTMSHNGVVFLLVFPRLL